MSEESSPAGAVPTTASLPAIGSCYRFENVEFDELKGELRVAGHVVAMEPRPLLVLAELLLRVNEVVTKEELFDSVWEGRPTVDHVLANAISKLRLAMGEAGGARIVTAPRVGYRLNGPVQLQNSVAPRTTFARGQAVPGREGFVLERALGEASRSEVWLARHRTLGQEQVFKFASDGPGLSGLKREFTLYRVLTKELGPRKDLVAIKEAQFHQAPYFIECDYGGPNLLQWAEQDGRLALMSLDERLALFLQIAQTVAAAHGVGVLHKDLKPSNVLVSDVAGQLQLRLTDFGSGQLLNAELLQQLKLTQMGLTAVPLASPETGTYLYMAPELLAGQSATVQSDVFALGNLLYQLAVADLKSPLVTGWQRAVGESLLVQDIEAATDGALQTRISSAGGLARRVAQLRQREAELKAAQAQAAQDAAELAESRRRRARRPWMAMGVGGLVLGLAASLWMTLKAERSRAQAQAAQQQAQAVSNFLQHDVLQAPDVVISPSVQPLVMLDVMRRASRNAAERFKGQPLAEAAIRRKIAESFLQRAAVAEAIKELMLARQLLTGAVAADDEELLTVQFLLVRSWLWGRDLKPARELYAQVAPLAGAQRLAANTELGAVATRVQSEFLLVEGKAAQAVPLAQKLVQQADAIYPPTSPRRLDARQNLAEVYVKAGEDGLADALMKELALPPFNARSMDLELRLRREIAKMESHLATGRYDELEKFLLESRQQLQEREVQNPFFLAWMEYGLGDVNFARCKFSDSLAQYQRAIPQFTQSVGAEHVYFYVALQGVAKASLQLGYSRAALEMFEQIDRFYKNNTGNAHSLVQFELAKALTANDRPQEALDLLHSLPIHRLSTMGGRNMEFELAAERAQALLALGRTQEVVPLLRYAVKGMAPLVPAVTACQVKAYEKLLLGQPGV